MKRAANTLFSIALLVVGCREAPREAAPASAPSAAPAVTTPQPLPVDPQIARLPLGDRLGLEASARPALAIRPEQLHEALAARGVSISRKRQVLASTLGAAYCEMAVSNEGLGISLCEFSDAAAARAGSERSHQSFDSIVPGRSLVTRDNTLLTVTRAAGAGAESQLALVLAAFAEQRPTTLATKTALAPEARE